MRSLLLALVAVTLLASPAEALVPGPWKLVAHDAKTGRAPTLLVQGRWTYQDEYGPASGLVEKPPIPKRMAFVITESPRQRVHVVWTDGCHKNGDLSATRTGVVTGAGTVTIYPKMYAKRVECDPYVVAKLAGRGTVAIRIYAY
jgi:hypothetical protein